jgi:hypothetical protein
MGRRDELLELLRPPAHRGPLIAAGAVLLTLGVALEELRLGDVLPRALHVTVVAAAAALVLGLGVQAPLEHGRPPAYQSVLLVCGLLLAGAGLLELAGLLGADYDVRLPAGALAWTAPLWCALALLPAARRNSAICGLMAAIAVAIAVLAVSATAGLDSAAATRWILLGLAVAYALGSLPLRDARPRHAELLVIAAGLATLAIVIADVLTVLGADAAERGLPAFWELVVLVAGCGLIAYGAVDRVHGAAWLGLANLVGFVVAGSEGAGETLRWWPLVLLALGAGVIAAGLRPRRPLPPEPGGYSVERPLASRADDEVTAGAPPSARRGGPRAR